MVGPSAIGSENGTPSSMMSAPPATSACISGSGHFGCRIAGGDEGMSALRPPRQPLETVCWIVDMDRMNGQRPCRNTRRGREDQNWMPDFSATVCISLSPRPDRLTSRTLSFGGVGASLAA